MPLGYFDVNVRSQVNGDESFKLSDDEVFAE